MKQFFITFFANLAALLVVFGAPVFLLMILIIASFSASAKGQRLLSVERGSILVFDFSLNVNDSPEHATPVSPLDAALNNNNNKSVTLRHLTTALEKAAKDDRIKALFLTGSFEPADFGTGYACLKELREAILDFKQSGKKVYAYLEAPSTRDYYVASAASYIYMNPFGEMETPGLASIKTYYADFFQKYGIDVQVTRVGKYKSAVEPFTLDKMSDADREETQKLLDDLWGDFVSAVAESRKIDPAAFQQLVDAEGYILPESALSAGLVDKLSYLGDVLKDLGKLAPASDYALVPLPFKQISIEDYMNAGRTPKLPGESRSDNVVAILYLEGEIVDGWGDTSNIGGDRFAAQLRELQRDNDVKAVVLRVNSPGGSAYASEVIQNEIIKLKEKRKPVIVSMGNYAASGGYWVSTYGDRIFAEPNTITGSIGVFGLFMDIQKLANGFGFTFDTAKTGSYADFETISRPKTPQEIALAQSRVTDLYQKFLKKVADSRHMPVEAVEFIAEGRVWSGSDALNIKLVDEIGGLDQAVSYAAEKAGISSNYRVKEYPEQMSFAEALAILLNNNEQPLSHAKADPLTEQFLKMKADLKSLEDFNDPLGMYARLPLGWDIK
ncbi:MAG TPA: signal peptide peptidase SppA [Candidatus Methylacidiphilales bacterium]|nr:signal peptide peptidase SppA [Candidatus Methylacidiphilales bacterium]